MVNKFSLLILETQKTIMDCKACMLVATALDGVLGIMNNHIPMATSLKKGTLKIYKDDLSSFEEISINGGSLMINSDLCTVLLD
jgi:F0F1-type ATP synthase epsilon subunit